MFLLSVFMYMCICCLPSLLQMCVMYRAVLEVTAPLFPPDQTNRLQDIVSQHLPHSGMGGGGRGEGGDGEEGELVRAVEDEMRERHLQIQLEVTEKVSQYIQL